MLTAQLRLVGVTDPLFTEDALELVYSTTNGLVRKINNLLTMALLIGSQKQIRTIDAELVYAAQQECDRHLTKSTSSRFRFQFTHPRRV